MEPLPKIIQAEESLRSYCQEVNFSGWDPWDALESPLFCLPPFRNRLFRWAGNHLIKISPINVRPFLGIRKDCFAKGLALFISGYVLRQKHSPEAGNGETIARLYQRLKEKIIPGYSGPCWGTNVAYQTRAFYVPAQTPSLVHTAFAVEALLDLDDLETNPELIETARGACRFALNDLKVRPAGSGVCFSYTPQDDSRVINVTALAARMLARTGRTVGDETLIQKARQAALYVMSQQTPEGSWYYGQDPIHHWVDNYHTGFVLEALADYQKHSRDPDENITRAVQSGAEYYRKRLFLKDGTPKFSPDSVSPIDGHCLAQGILTFTRLEGLDPINLPFARTIALWGIEHFQTKKGYFYFQRRRYWLNRISHIRWVQAWMFLALNRLLLTISHGENS